MRSYEHPTQAEIELRMNRDGLSYTSAAIECALISNNNNARPIAEALRYWEQPNDNDGSDLVYVETNMRQYGGWLAEWSDSVAESIQFPKETAFAHLLGMIAGATAFRMRYEAYEGGSPTACNLYIVTSQPPSTGKSGVHGHYISPIYSAFETLNKERSSEQAKIKHKLEDLKAQLKKTEAGNARDAIIAEIEQLNEDLQEVCVITPTFSDMTPEAAEAAAATQNGFVNMLSDEGEILTTLLGKTYSKDNGASANHGFYLKAWDTERMTVARVTRKAYRGDVYGTLAVIAQASSIINILETGQSGRGVSERSLLLLERPIIGERNHLNYTPINRKLKARYNRLIDNIIKEDQFNNLEFNEDGRRAIAVYRNNLEAHLKDGGKWSNDMLRGAIGKADKHIMKLACILHIAKNWDGDYPKRTIKISVETVERAINIYNEFKQTYIASADALNFFGENTEIAAIEESLKRRVSTGKTKTTIRALRDIVKNNKAFSNKPNLTQYLRDSVLPALEKRQIIATVPSSDDIFINPHLKE